MTEGALPFLLPVAQEGKGKAHKPPPFKCMDVRLKPVTLIILTYFMDIDTQSAGLINWYVNGFCALIGLVSLCL